MHKLNLETIVKMPIVENPYMFLMPNGCGCAFGILYAAAGFDINWEVDKPGFQAISAADVSKWKNDLCNGDLKLYKIVKRAEEALLARGREYKKFTDEEFKKDLIAELVKAGYVEEKADVHVKAAV